MYLQPFFLNSLVYKYEFFSILKNNSNPWSQAPKSSLLSHILETSLHSGFCPYLSSETTIAKAISVLFIVDKIGSLYSIDLSATFDMVATSSDLKLFLH